MVIGGAREWRQDRELRDLDPELLIELDRAVEVRDVPVREDDLCAQHLHTQIAQDADRREIALGRGPFVDALELRRVERLEADEHHVEPCFGEALEHAIVRLSLGGVLG
jgi:hypothetical protein